MKKTIFTTIAFCMLLTLAGCGSSLPEMSGEDYNLVVNYAADLLLKHDVSYEERFVSREEIAKIDLEAELEAYVPEVPIEDENLFPDEGTPETNPGMTEPENPNPPGEKNPFEAEGSEYDEYYIPSEGGASGGIPAIALTKYFNMENFSVQYTGYEFCDSYPEGDDESVYLAIDASPGTKLMIFHFDVTNQNEAEKELDIRGRSCRFRIFINDGKQNQSLPIFMEQDLTKFHGTFAAGETKDLIIAIEVSESVATSEIHSVKLYIRDDKDSVTLLPLVY